MLSKRGNCFISTKKSKLDLDLICDFLINQSYWANARTREQIAASFKQAYCFGVYEEDQQIGFARMVTDCAVMAYLGDVFILQTHRGRGLGKWLIETVLNYADFKLISTWLLATKEAHDLYTRFGFTPSPHPERLMVKNCIILKSSLKNIS